DLGERWSAIAIFEHDSLCSLQGARAAARQQGGAALMEQQIVGERYAQRSLSVGISGDGGSEGVAYPALEKDDSLGDGRHLELQHQWLIQLGLDLAPGAGPEEADGLVLGGDPLQIRQPAVLVTSGVVVSRGRRSRRSGGQGKKAQR